MAKYLKPSDLDAGGPVDYEKIGKVTAESVRKHTGKDWMLWLKLLEKAGARAWTYREIAAYLKAKHGLPPWWQHEVALGFEIAAGRRKAGQDARGRYMVTATKSLPHSASMIWKALLSAAGQDIWLKPLSQVALAAGAPFETDDGYFGEVRTVTGSRRLRLFWQDPLWENHTVVEVLLVPKPGKKTILVFNHTGIRDAVTKARLRARWRAAADGIGPLLARNGD